MLKNASREEICEAIETVINGKTYLHFDVAQTLRKKQRRWHARANPPRKVVPELIAEGMTNSKMTRKLFISTATINTHRKNLPAKFSAKKTATLIKIAVQMKMV